MTQLELELAKLRKAVVEMMELAQVQLEKSKQAFLAFDTDLAQEVIHNEKRINAMELSIDSHCENILALFHPVATDLRFVISVLKINSDLERIGDNADGIAAYIANLDKSIVREALEATKTPEMFDITISMLADIQTAYEKGDTRLARKVYKKDVKLNTINHNASRVITKLVKEDKAHTRSLLYLFSTIRKLERVGDHIKNIAEDVIFHIEAEVMKHKKDKKKQGGKKD